MRRSPVVLVPGYGGNRTEELAPIVRALTVAGFGDLHVQTHDLTTSDVPTLTGGLSATCRAALRTARTSQVHLVGHSLGGVLIRYAFTRLGLAVSVGAAVTVASPHRRTSWHGSAGAPWRPPSGPGRRCWRR